MRFKVYMTLETDTHPRKWVYEAVDQGLEEGETILEYEVEPTEFVKNA